VLASAKLRVRATARKARSCFAVMAVLRRYGTIITAAAIVLLSANRWALANHHQTHPSPDPSIAKQTGTISS
ncbi:hypothetical protein Q4595_26895, partial [Wenyingzhuangia sp. 1_MG-2023]|nr:hypothetical protein [Wenyingzhuangia sp. 1_MG-2023]